MTISKLSLPLLATLISTNICFTAPLMATESTSTTTTPTWYQPTLQVNWYWQLQGEINAPSNAELLDVDLFDTSADKIKALHEQGKKVICYFSAGSHENWREDAKQFPENVLGKALDGWKGERWLDIRFPTVQILMRSRMELAKAKNCDGVEPDNVDAYTNNTGFPLTADDQTTYNLWLAQTAHDLNLSIGLKNAADIVNKLVDHFDFSLTEQCHQYNECDKYLPFIQQGKPVLNAEYAQRYTENLESRNQLCADANSLGLRTLILPLNLDGSFIYNCSSNN